MNTRQAKKIMRNYDAGLVNYTATTLSAARRHLSVEHIESEIGSPASVEVVEEVVEADEKIQEIDDLADDDSTEAVEELADGENEEEVEETKEKKPKKVKLKKAKKNKKPVVSDGTFSYVAKDYKRKSTISWMEDQLGDKFEHDWRKRDYINMMITLELPPHSLDLD